MEEPGSEPEPDIIGKIAAAIYDFLLEAYPFVIVEHVQNLENHPGSDGGRCDVVQVQWGDRWAQFLFESEGIAIVGLDRPREYCDPQLLSWMLGVIYDETGARPDDPTLATRLEG